MKEIISLIKENQEKFAIQLEPFSYAVLRNKLFELATLGIQVGCEEKKFEKIFSILELTQKFSRYSSSEWGFYTPSILNDFVITNVKRPKRLYNSVNNWEVFYRYSYFNEKLVCIESVRKDKVFSKKYFVSVENAEYSFEFFDYKNRVDICEATYNSEGKILTYANIITAGIESDNRTSELQKKIVDSSIMDFQLYHYNNSELEYADKFSRIYNFSPQLIGMEIGDRFYFVYGETGKIKTVNCDKNKKVCIFELENPEAEKFDSSGRSYEFLKKNGFIF